MLSFSLDIDLIPSNIVIYKKVDDDFIFIAFNKMAQKTDNIYASNLLGKKLTEVFPGVKELGLFEVLQRVYISGKDEVLDSAYYEDLRISGWRRNEVKKLPDGNLAVFYTDSSVEERIKKELDIQKNLLETMFHIIPDLIWLKDVDGAYLYCNSRFEQLYGAKKADILGRTDFDFVDAKLAKFFRKNDLKALEANAPRTNEEFLDFADGSYKGMFETTKVPLLDDDKKVIGVLGIAHDINERKEYEKKLKKYANYDSLTGLANRTLFIERLTQLLKQRDIKGIVNAVLFIDLDRFKIINDEQGHATGDKVLIEVSRRLNTILRRGDTLARFGGDEFTILLENIKNDQEASTVAKKILESLREAIRIDEKKFYITASIGIAISPDDSREVEALLNYSDVAMYRAKAKGKDTYEFFN